MPVKDLPSVRATRQYFGLALDTPLGLFAARVQDSISMVTPGTDGKFEGTTPEEVKDWQISLIELRHPTTALALFYAVAALEDYLRDCGSRLARAQGLESHFPLISELEPKLLTPAGKERPDRDPAPLLNPQQVNALYGWVFDVEPLEHPICAKLADLALLRHTIAHHGSVIRPLDTARFSHFHVSPNQIVCPPVAFVLETAKWIFDLGSSFSQRLRTAVFPPVLSELVPIDRDRPPEALKELIEAFGYFGKLATEEDLLPDPLPNTGDMNELWRWQHARNQRHRDVLLSRCVDDLLADAGSS
jgi:hypothetical protein